MTWLLDTNVLSEGARLTPNSAVIETLSKFARDEAWVSVVSVAELREGLDVMSLSQRRTELADWMSREFLSSFGDRILPVTVDILIDWLGLTRRLKAKGRPQASADLLIASTARMHGLTMVTRNWRDFTGTGLTVFDPWTGTSHQMESL